MFKKKNTETELEAHFNIWRTSKKFVRHIFCKTTVIIGSGSGKISRTTLIDCVSPFLTSSFYYSFSFDCSLLDIERPVPDFHRKIYQKTLIFDFCSVLIFFMHILKKKQILKLNVPICHCVMSWSTFTSCLAEKFYHWLQDHRNPLTLIKKQKKKHGRVRQTTSLLARGKVLLLSLFCTNNVMTYDRMWHLIIFQHHPLSLVPLPVYCVCIRPSWIFPFFWTLLWYLS